MRKVFTLLVLFCAAVSACQRTTHPTYDVVVYGGTSAGIIAAYSAIRLGHSVLLVSPTKHLGGLTTGGLGYTDIGNKYAIQGLALDFYRRVGAKYGVLEQWIFEPHVAREVFDDYIRNGQIEIISDYSINEVAREGGVIQSITIASVDGNDTRNVSAKVFIDCSYEGDLMAKAGVTYVVGREANDQYNETYNGVQLMTGHQFPDGVDPYREEGNPESGLLWGISGAPLAKEGSGDKKVQAYNFRICLTDDPANRVEITRPDNYDSTRYELLLRLFKAQPDKRRLNDYFIWSRMPNRKTDINNRGGFSTDMIGMNHTYAEATTEERRAIVKAHEDYTKGLLWFYKTDTRVPEELRTEMGLWGYPKDEYTDNDHWSPQLYIREARRMVGAYVMTQANCEGREVVEDGIALAAYTMDSHNCQRLVIVKNGRAMVKNEGNVEIGGFGPYPIAYRSITPKETECQNLLVPVCLSASHIAYGSIRMEPVFMVLAQSAAVAASLAIAEDLPVQRVDAARIQARLQQDPLLDGTPPQIVVDNEDTEHVDVVGSWRTETSGAYGASMFVGREGAVTFRPSISGEGEYDVYVYYVSRDDGARQTKVSVYDGRNSVVEMIARESVTVEGQTSGKWVYVGHYRLGDGAHVELTGDGEGVVVADAVLFLPRGN